MMKDAKKVGEYEATVHYHKEVEVKVPVNVVAENAPVAAPTLLRHLSEPWQFLL